MNSTNHPLIGQTVALKKRVDIHNSKTRGPIEIVSYDIDDPKMAAALDGFRVHLPGRAFTCDFVMGRMNCSIDVDTGVIDRVWQG